MVNTIADNHNDPIHTLAFVPLVDWELFGLIVKELRLRKRLTQAALSEHSKLVDSYISQIEKGRKTNVSLEAIKSLGTALDMPPKLMMLLSIPLDKVILKLIISQKKKDRYNRLADIMVTVAKAKDTEISPLDKLQFKLWHNIVNAYNLEHVFDEYFVNK